VIDLKHEIERELSLIDPPDLWDRIQEDASNDGAAAVLDLNSARNRRHPARWLAVAAVVALLALVGVLAIQGDDDALDTVPATGGGDTTTTEAPKVIAFAAPSSFDLPDEWTLMERDLSFYHFAVGPADGLPATRIDFAIPEAATPEAATADLAVKASSLSALGDPVDATVGNLPATCMDVEAREGDPGGTPLVQTRGSSTDSSVAVVLEQGAVGRVCVAEAPSHAGEPRVPLVVLVQAPRTEFATFLEEAEGVLDGLDF
jgi:hypothetical protein